MAKPGPEERERTLELLNTEFDQRIAVQAAATNSIDTKATFLIGFAAIGLQIFLGEDRGEPWSGMAFVAFGVAFLLGLACIALREFPTVPKPAGVKAFYEEHCEEEGRTNLREQVLGRLIGTKAEALAQTTPINEEKARLWRGAAVIFLLAFFFSVVSVLEGPDGARPEQRPRPSTTSTKP